MYRNDMTPRDAPARTSEEPELGPSKFLQVAEGVCAWIQQDGTWWSNNAGLFVGGRYG